MTIQDLLPVAPNQSDLTMAPVPNTGIDTQVDNLPGENTKLPNTQDWWEGFKEAPATLDTRLEPMTFDWDKSNADRFVQDKYARHHGFDPYMGSKTVDGKSYDLNELRYAQTQTFGDVMSKAAGGFAAITRNAFTEGWKGDARLFNALFNWGSDKTFKERLIGTPEELEARDIESKRIMNKYAIYHTPESDNSVFNKQFLGDIIQQLGFTVGTTAQMLLEAALTWGIGQAFSGVAKGVRLAGIAEKVASGTKAIPLAEQINDVRKATDISRNTTLMRDMVGQFGRWSAKQLNPLTGAGDMLHMWEAGATKGQLALTTVGAAKRLFSQTNMAATEARFEAAGTFGQMYGDLLNNYRNSHDRQEPIGADLDRIQKAAYGAATDNFIANTGILMTMNQVQFGNLFSKFSSGSKLLRGALEQGEGKLFTVTGKIGEKKATRLVSGFNEIRKDFGMGTAVGAMTKRALTGTAAKFEITEGLQEILQNASDTSLREYYTNLYNGNKDLDGNHILDADWSKAMKEQYSQDGWRTFLMGAVTGLAMSPLQAAVMYGVRKGYGKVSDDYKGQLDGAKQLREENKKIQNAFYKDINNVLNENLANLKVQGQGAKTMEEALARGDKYTYINAKDDVLTKAIASSLKTNTYNSLIDTLREYSEMSDEELLEAFPALEKTASSTRGAREYIQSIAEDIERYHDNWESLKERFGHVIMPELYRNQEDQGRMKAVKKYFDNAIETLATTSYHATETIKRAGAIHDEVSAFPSIGSNLYTTFDIFSNPVQITTEISLLEQQEKVLNELGNDKEIKEDKKNVRERLKAIRQWVESPSQETFDKYIEADYNQAPKGIMDRSNLHRAFELLQEYIQLKEDNKGYVEALNVLNNPVAFSQLYERIADAMNYAAKEKYKEQEKESNDLVDEEFGEEEETTEPDTEKSDKDERDAMKEDYSKMANTQWSAFKQNWKMYPDLLSEIDAIQSSSPEEVIKQVHAEIDRYFTDKENERTEKGDYPSLSGRPHIALSEKKYNVPIYKIVVNGEELKPQYTHVKDANKALDEWVDENHPVIPETEYRQGQIVYEGQTPYKLVWRDKQLYIRPEKEGTKNKDKKISIEDLSNYTDEPVEPKPVDTHTPFNGDQPKSSDPYATVNIGANDGDKEQLTRNLLSIPDSHMSGEGFRIVVQENTRLKKGSYPIEGNDQIFQKGQQYSIRLDHDGTTVGYITNPSPQVYKAPGVEKTVQQLTESDVTALYKMTDQFPTAADWLKHLIQMDNYGAGLQALIDKALSNDGVLELEGALELVPHYRMDWIKTGETGPKLSELEGLRSGEDGLKVYVYNNYTGDRIWSQSTDHNEEAVMSTVEPIGQVSYYTAVVQLNNGRYVPIQLTPRQMKEEEGKELIKVLGEADNNEKIEAANKLLDKTFIALRVYDEDKTHEKGIRVTPKLAQDSKGIYMYVPVWFKEGKETVSLGTGVIRQSKFDSIEDLVDKINTAVENRNTKGVEYVEIEQLTPDNIKWQPDNITDMECSVNKNIISSISLSYKIPDKGRERINESKPVIKAEQAPIPEDVLENAPEEAPPTEEEMAEIIEDIEARRMLDKLNSRKNKDKELKAKKGVPKVATEGYIEDINRFRNFVSTRLPENISVGELDTVAAHMSEYGTTVGQFVIYLDTLGNVKGRIETTDKAPYKYHEAFHGVFRLLSTKEEQDRLRNMAPNPSDGQLEQLRVSHPRYTDMGKEELVKEWKEEWLADRFDDYSMNRPYNTGLRGLFDKIKEWIRYIADLLTGNRLRAMFYRIHTGDYRNARLQQNEYTENVAISVPVPKAILIGYTESTVKLSDGSTKEVVIERYLPPQQAGQVAADITAMVLLDVKSQKYPSYDKAIEAALNRYENSYYPASTRNLNMLSAITNKAAREKMENDLMDIYLAVSEEEPRQVFKDNILEQLRIQGVKERLLEEDTEQDETGRSFQDKATVGGYSTVPSDMRTYIATTTMKVPDMFGYEEYEDGTPVRQAVDSNRVYNGMLSMLSQKSTVGSMIDDILRDHSNNPDLQAFIDRWLSETGFDRVRYETTGEMYVTDTNLFHKVIKTFAQHNNDYVTVVMDPENKRVIVTDAGRRAPERNQFNTWSNAFYQNFYKEIEQYRKQRQTKEAERVYKEAIQPVNKLIDQTLTISDKKRKISDNDLEQLAKELSYDIQEKIGINWHPDYIKFTIISGKTARTEDQDKFLLLYPVAQPVDNEGLRNLKNLLREYENPFTRSEGAVVHPIENWLLKTARYNGMFDNNIDTMSFVNTNKDNVYKYQYPNYDTRTVQALNGEKFLALQNNPDTMSSYLLSDPRFISMDKKLVLLGGITLQSWGKNKEDGEAFIYAKDYDTTGTDFSEMDDREYTVMNLSLYDISTNPDAVKKDEEGNTYYRVPVSLGPIAEKGTHHCVYIPVGKWIEKGNITDAAKENIYKEVSAEVKRIQQCWEEIKEGRDSVIARGGLWIDGYHNGDQRGLKLMSTADLMNRSVGGEETVKELLEQKALQPGYNVEQEKGDIYKAIEEGLKAEIEQFKQDLIAQELMTDKNKNLLLPQYLFSGIDSYGDKLKERDSKLNLIAGKFDHNLAQVFLQNYIGYIGLSRMLYGDKAKSSKSTQDWWKRMAGNNASIISANPVVNSEEQKPLSTIKTILYPSLKFQTIQETKGEADDGQAYVTAEGYNTLMNGLGRNTELRKRILEKVKRGKDLTVEEYREMLGNKATLGALKPVAKDMYPYYKCSVSAILRQDSSYKVNGKWESLPGRDYLYDKLESAEKKEADGYTVLIGNKTISKGMTANLVEDGDDLSQMYTDLDAMMLGIQTELPPTGLTGTKSTQPDKQVTSGQIPTAPVYINGKWKTAQAAIDQYMNSIAKRKQNNALTAISELFSPVQKLEDVGKVEFDPARFMEKALPTLQASGTDSQTLEMMTPVDGVAQYNLNIPSMLPKSENIYMSSMIKGVTKEKIPMVKLVLMSDAGMSVIRKVISLYPVGHEREGQPRTWEIVPMDEFKKDPKKYESVWQYKLDKDTDRFEDLTVGVYVADRLRDIIPEYDESGKVLYYYTEGLRSYLSVDEKQNNEFAWKEGFGARTPGTGYQSYRRVRWVDRLSDALYGTGVLSRDVMNATGHDYDADSLYTAIHDTYIKDGKRVQYGTATTNEGKFLEWVQWQRDNNPIVSKYEQEAMSEDDEVKQIRKELENLKVSQEHVVGKLIAIQDLPRTAVGLKDYKDYRKDLLIQHKQQAKTADNLQKQLLEINGVYILQALNEAQLPLNTQQWLERGGEELNNGVLTNRALDAQLALLSSESVSGGGKKALINRPTSTKLVTDLGEKLFNLLGDSKWAREIKNRISGNTGDMNSMSGQARAFKALNQGAEGIGGVANMIQVGSVLNQHGVKVKNKPYTFNGETYDEYTGDKHTQWHTRTGWVDILAQMHVDAPKDQLPSKWAINAEYAQILSNMIHLGQDIETALLYPQTYPWQAYAQKVAYSRRKFAQKDSRKSEVAILQDMINEVVKKGGKRIDLTQEKMIDYINKGERDWDIEYTLLDDLKTLKENVAPLKKMSRFMRFDTGKNLSSWEEIEYVQTGLSELGIGIPEYEFEKMELPIDVRTIITKDNKNLAMNYSIMRTINTLGKKVFIEKTNLYKTIHTAVLHQLKVPEYRKEWYKNLKFDIISYISLVAYKKMLLDKIRPEVLDTLDNDLVWSDGDKSIIAILTDLREQAKKNYAINSFLNTVLKGAKGSDINQVVANTWTRLSEQQQQNVVKGIVELVSSEKGSQHKGALALFNYLLVKDGGQFKSGSFIRFIPPFMMKDWSDAMTKVTDNLQDRSTNEEVFRKLFGMESSELRDKFVEAYVTHKDNQDYVSEDGDYYRKDFKLYKKTPEGIVEIKPDGDSYQWKGAKAVFGNYPTTSQSSPVQVKEPINTITYYEGNEKVTVDTETGIEVFTRRQELGYQLQQLEDAKKLMMENDADIMIALSMPKITPDSARKETGAKAGTKSDINPSLLSKTGVTVQQAAHNLMEDVLNEKSGMQRDEQYIRDVIIEVLQTGKNKFIDNRVKQDQIDNIKNTLREKPVQGDLFTMISPEPVVPSQITEQDIDEQLNHCK